MKNFDASNDTTKKAMVQEKFYEELDVQNI